MTKIQFIMDLYEKLSGLPQDDVDERLNFYSEMIDDRIEDGKTEEEAISYLQEMVDSHKELLPFFKEDERWIEMNANFK